MQEEIKYEQTKLEIVRMQVYEHVYMMVTDPRNFLIYLLYWVYGFPWFVYMVLVELVERVRK